MRYYISNHMYEYSDESEIDISKYELYDGTITKLFEMIFLEEKLDLFLESYFDFEVELLKIGMRYMIFNKDHSFSEHYDRNLLNKSLSSLLSASSLYFDQCESHLTRIFGRNTEKLKFLKGKKNELKNNDNFFRFFLKLRNHSQHHDIPIVSIKYSGSWTNLGKDGQLKFIIVPLVEISMLEKDTQFDKNIILIIKNENNNDDLLDLRPIIRQFVEKLGCLHLLFRDEIALQTKCCDQILKEMLIQVKDPTHEPNDTYGYLLKLDDNSKFISQKKFFYGLIDRRKIFEKKFSGFINLHKKFVSTEIQKLFY